MASVLGFSKKKKKIGCVCVYTSIMYLYILLDITNISQEEKGQILPSSTFCFIQVLIGLDGAYSHWDQNLLYWIPILINVNLIWKHRHT